MSNDHRDESISTTESDIEQRLDLDRDDLDSIPSHAPRREPQFSGFDDDDEEYEEPDRDTDYATVYAEEGEGEYFEENGEDELSADEDELSAENETGPLSSLPASAREEDYEWQEEDYPQEDESAVQQWPLGLIIVGVVALLLLAAGGYGVIQQRSAMEEEVRQLQASLATAASPEEVTASRAAVEEMKLRNDQLQTSLDTLTLDNKRLTDTVAGLEAQLLAQQEALSKKPVPPEPAPVVAKKPEPAKKAAAPEPKPVAASAGGNGWFVNFGSYARRDTAETWAARLKPGAGKVLVTTGAKDGKTLYRVRVVELANREEAQSIARKLEQEYDLSRLWVGQQ